MSIALVVIFALVQGLNGQNDFGILPGDTEPESYVLSVSPFFENSSFSGQVDILINVKTTTNVITLNSKDLILDHIWIEDEKTNRDVKVTAFNNVQETEQLQIWVEKYIVANRRYRLSLKFRGLLRDDATGFFKSIYPSESGNKWLAVTQFQPTHARSAFPCYDEPTFRTPFNISIKRKKTEIALSNMPIAYTKDLEEKISEESKETRSMTWVYFEQTPPMSTILVAFFVGEFETLPNKMSKNFINVYSHLGYLYQTEYASAVIPDLLSNMETYTGIKHALPKLDLLAVPELSLGAMENWGLNTYREKSIFVTKNSKTKTIMSVKTMMQHVIAHQWFGDLVSPSHWDHAWLNEGFATYFEYFATARVEPKWRLEHFFVTEKHQMALEYDQVLRHPLRAHVRTPKDINGIFDRITYDKGAAILRMLKTWVGSAVFQHALNMYLNQNQYKVVNPQQLWNAFDNALYSSKFVLYKESVKTIMGSWVTEAGYPIVNVTKKDGSLILSQERFLIPYSDKDELTQKWYIGLSYTTNQNKDFSNLQPTVWLNPNVNETVIDIATPVDWFIFNLQSTGFYRVNYWEDNWLSLIKQLKNSPNEIHVLNRAQLIDDAFNLARAGVLNYSMPLNLISYLEKENDVIPWFTAMYNLDFVLERMRYRNTGYDDIKTFVSKFSGIAYKKVNDLMAQQQNTNYPINISWNAFSNWACKMNHEDCVKSALDYFRRWQNGEEISSDIKDTAFCVGMKSATDDSVFDKMIELYKTTKVFSEKESAINALACTENTRKLVKHLETLLENKFPIEPQDYETLFNTLSSTPTGILALIIFLEDNTAKILEKVPNSENMVTNIFSILASKVSAEYEIERLFLLKEDSSIPPKFATKFREIYDSKVLPNILWFNRYSKTIREYIKPGSTNEPVTPLPPTSTEGSSHDSSASSMHNCVVLSQILAISVSVLLFVDRF